MENGYFFCGDILGFSNIVESLHQNTLEKKIANWSTLVKDSAETSGVNRFQLVSDTVFATSSKLETLILFARQLLNNGINESLPIRGAISYGEFKWGELVYGRAVIAAHELETKQNWIGVIVDHSVNFTESYEKLGLVCYPVPTQSHDEIRLFSALQWDVPTFEALSSKLTNDGLGGPLGKGKTLNWDWGNKVGNTVLFGIYLKALETQKKPANKFYGIHPIHHIDLTLQALLNK